MVYASYIHTLLFSIISLAICVGLVLIVVAGQMKDIFVIMLVVDIGILAIIIGALTNIVNTRVTWWINKKTSNSTGPSATALDDKQPVRFTKCPDYFKYETDPNGNIVCTNGITLYDMVANTNIQYKLLNAYDLDKDQCTGDENKTTQSIPSPINLSEMYSGNGKNTNDKKIEDVLCDPKYKFVAWTAFRPFCKCWNNFA
jgi:hypothetical protein